MKDKKNENKKIIAVNFKMNGNTQYIKSYCKELMTIARQSNNKIQELIIALPSIYLNIGSKVVNKTNIFQSNKSNLIKFYSQSCSRIGSSTAAYTGGISSEMIADVGAMGCIIGHSESRQYDVLSSDNIKHSIQNIVKSGLSFIYCIGENIESHNQGIDHTKEFLKSQINNMLDALKDISSLDALDSSTTIAYEPIWAIGSKNPARPEYIKSISEFIKQYIKNTTGKHLNVLYGGSVNSSNCKEIVYQGSVDGLLIGKAGLDIAELSKIIQEI